MLHNKSTGLKPDVMSTETLVDWLETKPANETYSYFEHRSCLVAQYLTDKGYDNVFAYSMGHFDHGGATDARFPMVFDDIAAAEPRTFGAALKRAKKALEDA
jgi:hypothetical protein